MVIDNEDNERPQSRATVEGTTLAFSPVRGICSRSAVFYRNSEERPAVGQRSTNADTDGALDVDEYVSSEWTSLLPPSELNKLKQRRKRKQQGRPTKKAKRKTQTKQGGSRLVRNNHVKNMCGSNI